MGCTPTALQSHARRSTRRPKPPPRTPVLAQKSHSKSHPGPSKPGTAKSGLAKYVRHESELDYIRPDWSDEAFVNHFKNNAFDVPPRNSNTSDPRVYIRAVDGRTTEIPRAYRLPLLIMAYNQWISFRELIFDKPSEWEIHKFDVLHLSRLCNAFLGQAREAAERGDLDRDWRCPMFDRVLTRLYLDWFSCRDEWVENFWKECGEKPYASDPLKKDWGRWLQSEPQGFVMHKKRGLGGITATEMLRKCRRVTLAGGKIVWHATASRYPAMTGDAAVKAAQGIADIDMLIPTDEPEIRMDMAGDLAGFSDVSEPELDESQGTGEDIEEMVESILNEGFNEDAAITDEPMWGDEDGADRGRDVEGTGGTELIWKVPADVKVKWETGEDNIAMEDNKVGIIVDPKRESIVEGSGQGDGADRKRKVEEMGDTESMWTVPVDVKVKWETAEDSKIGVVVDPKRESIVDGSLAIVTDERTRADDNEGGAAGGKGAEEMGGMKLVWTVPTDAEVKREKMDDSIMEEDNKVGVVVDPGRGGALTNCLVGRLDKVGMEVLIERAEFGGGPAEDTPPDSASRPAELRLQETIQTMKNRHGQDIQTLLQACSDSCKALREELTLVKVENGELRRHINSQKVLMEEVQVVKAEHGELLQRIRSLEVQLSGPQRQVSGLLHPPHSSVADRTPRLPSELH